jgi:glycosyltransferase involved in cell wall biosynthesis
LEKFVQEKGLQHRVKFIGSVSRPDVAYWLSAANVFCFLTLRVEGQPLNQMEALAAGLPSVLSESVAGCLPLQPGILSVDPNDPQEVANALRVAIELAKRGLRTSLPKEFTLDRCVADYLRALTGMIEG